MPQFVYKCSDQLTDKLFDSEESFVILRAIKPYRFEPLAKRVTGSINCEELAAGSGYIDPEEPPVPPTPGSGPQQKLDRRVIVCVGLSLIDKSKYSAWMRVFPSSYRITSFKIKWYFSVHGSPVDAWGSPICGLY